MKKVITKILIPCFALFSFFNLFSSNFITEYSSSIKENRIISKIKLKKSKSKIDTLWVSQNDTAVFRKETALINRPCSKPKMQIYYELINPKVETYYFIYNEQNQLVIKGKYTSKYTYEGACEKKGVFYNKKKYFYKNNGNLKAIHYMEDGRNSKYEIYDSKKRLKKITYYDKKSSEKLKIEIYSHGQLKETRIYTSFDRYYTVKADN
ncbi:hypothetical protein HNQ02_003277 [Flavobacterium sp. 7E]|uniref:hypothetical protein n=1 Tax=Flavobacterium sp. 7E TaxID=2735898 RepID=UPI00156F2196|nr:hypothetical protein [Flavobacterium sp. 7E]NRS90337.1 hypothetical protein [Flavobacterium sp. 7E]